MRMKKQSLRGQAALITGCGAAVRAMGFLMRLWISRALGAEAVGIMELASGVHTLAVGALPPLHKDPFDRLLIAQAVSEPMRFLTHDEKLAPYSELIEFV